MNKFHQNSKDQRQLVITLHTYVMSGDLTGSFRRSKFYRRYLQLLWRTSELKRSTSIVIKGKQFVDQRYKLYNQIKQTNGLKIYENCELVMGNS